MARDPWMEVMAITHALDALADWTEEGKVATTSVVVGMRSCAEHLREARVNSQTPEALDAQARAGGGA
jgi:hypothetical protein